MIDGYELKYESVSGGLVYVHTEQKKDEADFNLKFAIILANLGKLVKVLPYRHGQKNPDVEVDGQILDFKNPKNSKEPHTAIQNHIRKANQQGAEIVMIILDNPMITIRDIKRALIAAITSERNKNIKSVWLMHNDDRLVELSRENILDKSFISRLGQL